MFTRLKVTVDENCILKAAKELFLYLRILKDMVTL